MSPDEVANFFGLMLLGGVVGLVALAARPGTRAALADAGLGLVATVAAGATLGSLYFSERAGFVPCELCWFQRIAMYPLAVILTIAAVRNDDRIGVYALPLAGAGLAVAIYHVQLQWFPDQSSFCEVTNPCSGRWVEAFGWMTIPQMAGISFTLVIGLLVASRVLHTNHDPA